ncbi:MAG TPA: hypothetical protein VJ719_06140 [Chthoniobacterales bacterium]|nr:hypothetical protein [Chthoniobacterales bacterium]
MNEQSGQKSSGVPLTHIMKQVYNAAISDRTDAIDDHPLPINAKLDAHWGPIKDALNRAYRKSTVQAVKPLRRLLRNQGAVNDSMIEALFQLTAQMEELVQEMTELQRRINMMQARLTQIQRPSGSPEDTAEAK